MSAAGLRRSAVRAFQLYRSPGIHVDLTSESAGDFLLSFPRGAYTTARTLNCDSLVEYGLHMDRLADSLQIMSFGDPEPSSATSLLSHFRSRATLEPLLLPLLRSSLRKYHDAVGRHDARLTVLVTYDPSRDDVITATHVAALPDVNHAGSAVTCDVAGAPRNAAAAKDSQWVRDRAALEALKSRDANELLLCDAATGDIYEGLTSNFFAVDARGAIETAPDGDVLAGTMRALALGRCAEIGISVRHRHPNVAEAATWRGAFITSTSRGVMPVGRIRILETGHVVDVPEDDGVRRLAADVAAHMADRSQLILDE